LLESLTANQRAEILASLPEAVARSLLYDWRGLIARPKQIAPDWQWVIWLILAGRGFGKTRCGAEWIREKVETGKAKRIILAAPTADDLRDIMIEGESGILATASPWCKPTYVANRGRVEWPNGAKALCISAEKPDRFRGKQCDAFWAEELASWRYPDAWTQLQLGFRLGATPQGIVTTTPRPIPLVKALLARNGNDVAVTRGTTYENRSNLAPAFFDAIIRQYEGTRLGRQELQAEVLEDNPGALWQRPRIDALRVATAPELRRVVVAIDPAVTANPKSNETGIVVVGLGIDGHAYVLDDKSGIFPPAQWAARAVAAFDSHRADKVIGETNNGGDLVESNVRTARNTIPYEGVHASRGKMTRAEPISALYEQGRVHHVGVLAKLEDQMCAWDPVNDDGSPDRVDALVWGLTFLMIGPQQAPQSRASTFARTSCFDDE
jgi:phage terminase large subunit-like protein